MECDLILCPSRAYAVDPAALPLCICLLFMKHIFQPLLISLTCISGAGEMTPWLKALATLTIRFPAPKLGSSQEDT